MTYKLKKLVLYILLIILILLGVYVFYYYITAKEVGQLEQLPLSLLVTVVLYIVVQLIKRFVQENTAWYTYLYYIGLAAIVVALPFFSLDPDQVFTLSRIGVLFLIISPLVEFAVLAKSSGNKPNKVEPEKSIYERNQADKTK